jgi:hypothetical protein
MSIAALHAEGTSGHWASKIVFGRKLHQPSYQYGWVALKVDGLA